MQQVGRAHQAAAALLLADAAHTEEHVIESVAGDDVRHRRHAGARRLCGLGIEPVGQRRGQMIALEMAERVPSVLGQDLRDGVEKTGIVVRVFAIDGNRAGLLPVPVRAPFVDHQPDHGAAGQGIGGPDPRHVVMESGVRFAPSLPERAAVDAQMIEGAPHQAPAVESCRDHPDVAVRFAKGAGRRIGHGFGRALLLPPAVHHLGRAAAHEGQRRSERTEGGGIGDFGSRPRAGHPRRERQGRDERRHSRHRGRSPRRRPREVRAPPITPMVR